MLSEKRSRSQTHPPKKALEAHALRENDYKTKEGLNWAVVAVVASTNSFPERETRVGVIWRTTTATTKRGGSDAVVCRKAAAGAWQEWAADLARQPRTCNQFPDAGRPRATADKFRLLSHLLAARAEPATVWRTVSHERANTVGNGTWSRAEVSGYRDRYLVRLRNVVGAGPSGWLGGSMSAAQCNALACPPGQVPLAYGVGQYPLSLVHRKSPMPLRLFSLARGRLGPQPAQEYRPSVRCQRKYQGRARLYIGALSCG
jgi:hypothetical protein